MLILSAMIGFAVLVMGRQLFWVFVAGVGFILGAFYASQFYQGSPLTILLISFAAGVIGALLAYLLQRTAAGLAGFLAGWYLTAVLVNIIDFDFGEYAFFIPILGGIIGALLIAATLDWSLIVLSSLTGATMITGALQFGPRISNILFIILLVLGVAIQGILFSQEEYPKT